MSVTLFPVPELQPSSPLSKAKAAFSFTIHTSVQHISPLGKFPTIPVPTVVSYLVVACRRKLVIYSWRDGEPQEVQVIPPMVMPLSELKLYRKLFYPIHPGQCPLWTMTRSPLRTHLLNTRYSPSRVWPSWISRYQRQRQRQEWVRSVALRGT